MCWAQIAGMGASAGGSAVQGQQNAETMTANAELLDMKAEDSLKRGGVAEDIQRNKVNQVVGTQRAGMGASGVVVDSGSGGKVLQQTAAMGEMDAQTIRSNAMRESWGYKTEADNLRQQALAAGMMQRLLMPGMEDGKFEFIPSQRTMKASLLVNGYKSNNSTESYIRTGKG